ncbi:hypothetical protein PQX77_020272 [Marasmius sp. AFHP31]|nr:hypothetical protein PQX77_020272 [Marasmius sp. AFHP31]
MSSDYSFIFLWPDDADPFIPKTRLDNPPKYQAGIYPQCPFVPGGVGTHWLPIIIQVRKTKAQRVFKLLQPLINEFARIADRNVLINCFQNAETFHEVCQIMEEDSKTFWSLLIAKDNAIFYDFPSARSSWNASSTRLQAPKIHTHSSFAGAFFSMVTNGGEPLIDFLGGELISPSHFLPPAIPCTAPPGSPSSSRPPATPRREAPPISPTKKRGTAQSVTASSPLPSIRSPLVRLGSPICQTATRTDEAAEGHQPREDVQMLPDANDVRANSSSSSLPSALRGENVELTPRISNHASQYFSLHGYSQHNVGVLVGLYTASDTQETFQHLVHSIFRNLPRGEITYIWMLMDDMYDW